MNGTGMARVKLTKSFVESASCPVGIEKVTFFDTACRGLILEVRQSGYSVFGLRHIDGRGKQRQIKIGHRDDVTLDQARKQADKLRGRLALGVDVADEKRTQKLVPQVRELVAQYLAHVELHKKSWRFDEGLLRNHVLPEWGGKYVDELTKSDVVALFAKHRLTHAPGSCNRLLILLRYLFNLALKWEVSGLKVNPTAGYPLFKENNKQDRFLTKEEAERLYVEVLKSPNRMLQFIVPMLLLTGLRKRELLDAKWSDIDLDKKVWFIPVTKSGKPRAVPLSDTAISILMTVPRYKGCQWAFPNPATLKPFVSVFSSWNTARVAAGLKDVKVHSLRHAYASFLVNSGRTLYEVQHLLGHTQVKTTQRYSHLSQNTLMDATNAAARAVGDAFMLPPVNQTTSLIALGV
jgi:integrase